MSDLEVGNSFEWIDLCYSVKDASILKSLQGSVKNGQLLAVIGSSGAGKSTFLDLLANRKIPVQGSVRLNAKDVSELPKGSISYVEQHDALFGVLTVRETLSYSAQLCEPNASKADIKALVDKTMTVLGLSHVAKQRIGTPIARGISGGQKRRVTIGCALVTRPNVLLLDEPTSGLDSFSGQEVVKTVKQLARSNAIPAICSIHQPNWDTFSLFDLVLVLSKGRTVYFGPTERLSDYMKTHMKIAIPEHANPADYIIKALNSDFASVSEAGLADVVTEKYASPDFYADLWKSHSVSYASFNNIGMPAENLHARFHSRSDNLIRAYILIERNFVNYSRNLLGYGVRLGMYLGMGILLATVWVKLGNSSNKINDRLSVHFFSVAFLGFMSVAGIPTFLEERHVFLRERHNGLYTPLPYVLANSIVAIPFLATCSFVFSVISYWSIGLHPGAEHFFKFFMELFLAVYVAESQSVVVAALLPIFVAALAIASFLNGFWMCVQGYFIKAVNLPRFWYWWAHWIDYQTFAFNFLVNNDLRGLIFACPTIGNNCECSYPSSLTPDQCALRGEDVLKALDIGGISLGLYAGLLVLIAVVYRFLLWVVLVVRQE